MVLGLAVVVLLAGAAIIVITIWKKSRRHGIRRPPPVVYPLYPTRHSRNASPSRAPIERAPAPPERHFAPVELPPVAADISTPAAQPVISAALTQPPPSTAATLPALPSPATPSALPPAAKQPALPSPTTEPTPTNGNRTSKGRRKKKTQEIEVLIAADAEPDTSATVRFRRPTDDAVQVLPGRLEVVAGEPYHKEIRFVRRPGEQPEVILGRDFDGSPGHVELQSKTVSRRHARLAFANGQWRVANLSQTNPIVVNDEALAAGNGERTLADGDCLELGEVVLRFHSR